MSLEVIYVTRHGFRSSWSVDHVTGRYTSHLRSPTGLPTDPALTSHGVAQSYDLAEHLLGVDPPIEQVYSSPYYRCLQTISPFISKRNSSLSEDAVPGSRARIRVESGLSEWYGRAHFEHPTSAPLSDLNVLFEDLDANYVSSPAPHARGESIPQLYDRVASCIQAIIERCDQEGKKSVLLCTHAAVVIALGRILTAKVPEDVSVEDFGAFTCGLSVYRRQEFNKDVPTNINRAKAIGGLQECKNSPNVMQAVVDPRSPALDYRGPASPEFGQSCSFSISSHWTCEVNSDCSFLRGGEERGWKFSGDESFVEINRGGLLLATEPDSNSAVEEDGGNCSNGTSKL